MRVYINGRLLTPEENFVIEALWFADKDIQDFNRDLKEGVVCVCGRDIEGWCDKVEYEQRSTFSTRWIGAGLVYENKGKVKHLKSVSVEDIMEIVGDKQLINVECFCDAIEGTTIHFTDIIFVGDELEWAVRCDTIEDMKVC